MTHVRAEQMWWENRLAKEENGRSGNNSGEEEVEVTSAKGDPNPRSGRGNPKSVNCNPETGICHPKLGNRNPDSGNSSRGKENDQQGEESVSMDVNMVFMIPIESRASLQDIAEFALGAERDVFDKPENPSAHMKPLFIGRHVDGAPVGHILINGAACVNILPLSLFKMLSHIEGDLKHTNLSLSGFAGDLTDAKGIICMELMVGRKTVPTAFFVVDIKGRYNMLLDRDWIRTNECVLSSKRHAMDR
jgi:hypothetical protein